MWGMIKVTCEIGGRTVDINDKEGIRNATFHAFVEKGIEIATAALSEDEREKMEIQIVGDSIDDVTLKFHGPEELIEKIRASLPD